MQFVVLLYEQLTKAVKSAVYLSNMPSDHAHNCISWFSSFLLGTLGLDNLKQKIGRQSNAAVLDMADLFTCAASAALALQPPAVVRNYSHARVSSTLDREFVASIRMHLQGKDAKAVETHACIVAATASLVRNLHTKPEKWEGYFSDGQNGLCVDFNAAEAWRFNHLPQRVRDEKKAPGKGKGKGKQGRADKETQGEPGKKPDKKRRWTDDEWKVWENEKKQRKTDP
jgi:hypothetical protein